MDEFYDNPATVYGDLNWQVCRVETQCGRYYQPFLANSVPIPLGVGGITINADDGTTSLQNMMAKCQYCDGLGLRHIEDNEYWACRNCEMTGYVENEN